MGDFVRPFYGRGFVRVDYVRGLLYNRFTGARAKNVLGVLELSHGKSWNFSKQESGNAVRYSLFSVS